MKIFQEYGDPINTALFYKLSKQSVTDGISTGIMQKCHYRIDADMGIQTLEKVFNITNLHKYLVFTEHHHIHKNLTYYFPHYKIMLDMTLFEKVETTVYTHNNIADEFEDENAIVRDTTVDVSVANKEEDKYKFIFSGETVKDAYLAGITFYYIASDQKTVRFLEDLTNKLNENVVIPQRKETGNIAKLLNVSYVGDSFSLDSNYVDISNYKNIVDNNYNDSLRDVYDTIVTSLQDKEAGFYYFDGAAGTGKSSFILHLLGNKDITKNFIYLSADSMSIFTSPSFINFAKKYLKGTILIVEDAEALIEDRGINNDTAITNILNLTSGVYGSLLGIKIIATANTTSSVDKALLRKGRLKARYHFDLLTTKKSNKLLKILGVKETVTKPTSLANIYNFTDDNDLGGNMTKKTIGFN